MNALMIMCHKNPKQVIRLALRCHTKNTDIIIHCDSVMNDNDYNLISDFQQETSGIYLTKKRMHGVLDTRSLVDIAMQMVDCAKNVEVQEDKHYDYFLLCSGQDYVIKSMDYIERQLNFSYPRPFIDCTPYSSDNWVYYKFNTNPVVIKYKNFITYNVKKGVLRKIFRATQIVFDMFLKAIGTVSFKKLKNAGVELYGGSAWWILPDKAVNYINEEYNKQDEIQELLLDRSITPEETYFQIMAMRSPVKNQVEVNSIDMVEQNCKTWAYFSDAGKPFKGHPYIFTKNEFERIKNSKFWFARKFDESVDSDIMDMIDKEISDNS